MAATVIDAGDTAAPIGHAESAVCPHFLGTRRPVPLAQVCSLHRIALIARAIFPVIAAVEENLVADEDMVFHERRLGLACFDPGVELQRRHCPLFFLYAPRVKAHSNNATKPG